MSTLNSIQSSEYGIFGEGSPISIFDRLKFRTLSRKYRTLLYSITNYHKKGKIFKIYITPPTLFYFIRTFHFSDPTKYFGCELGAQTTIDHKTDKYIVNGSHTADKMQDILDGFIQKFVLCPKCENPETTLVS